MRHRQLAHHPRRSLPFTSTNTAEIDTATPEHRQYKPDFYLPDHAIYLEHFGIKRDGTTAPFVDCVKYQEGMKWKRDLHQMNGTKLLETYSWEKTEDVLLTALETKLQRANVTFKPISAAEVMRLLYDGTTLDPLAKLTGTFLSLFKSSGQSLADLYDKLVGGDSRSRSFLDVFAPLLDKYEELIKARGEIDFDDMITLAVDYVKHGKYRSPYKYIIVDEFQDIAVGRANLVIALRNQGCWIQDLLRR